MGRRRQRIDDPLLASDGNSATKRGCRRTGVCFLFLALVVAIACLALRGDSPSNFVHSSVGKGQFSYKDVIQSPQAVVAADDGRCSEIGVSMLEKGGHAVDAAVATALCLGVVSPMSSGIGGGGFMVVRSSQEPGAGALAIDMRETAPAAASQDMYAENDAAKSQGPLSMGVPGELAGLHVAWSKYGRLPWRMLFEPAIKLAKEGFTISPYTGSSIAGHAAKIRSDPGLRSIYAPNGTLLKPGDTCYNVELGNSLEMVAEQGPEAFYGGTIAEKLIEDVRRAGGILTVEDLRNYRVHVTNAIAVNTMGYTIYGMPPPSSGTVGLALVMNILESYKSRNATASSLGLHRLIEALKHMFAVRMNLGDPAFVDLSRTMSDMLSPSFAEEIRERIFDNTTFPPGYYMPKWSQLSDHGTSHFCVVDSDRNAVSLTTTVNYAFGGGVLSPSTGIVLNNEMDDFSIPTEVTPDKLPPAPANFISPNKRPLSSMTPLIVLKDNQLAGVVGGSGGLDIIPGVVQVFVNHFVLGMEPLAAVQNARVYHRLIPNVVKYENWTVVDGEHIELSNEKRRFLKGRGHELEAKAGGCIVQLVVQNLTNPIDLGRKGGRNGNVIHGLLTAVSDPRKGGCPAAI